MTKSASATSVSIWAGRHANRRFVNATSSDSNLVNRVQLAPSQNARAAIAATSAPAPEITIRNGVFVVDRSTPQNLSGTRHSLRNKLAVVMPTAHRRAHRGIDK